MRLLALTLLAVGCSAPNYGNGHLQCAPGSVCPSGFYCAEDEHCWRDGSGPASPDVDLGMMMSEGDLATSMIVDLATSTPPDLLPTPSKCSGLSGVILCDGFENPAGLVGWSIAANNGTATRDTSRFYRGGASLHTHISGAGVGAQPVALVHRSDIFPIAPPGTVYIRFWAYFTTGLPNNFEQFINLADNSSTGYSIATDHGKVTLDDYAAAVYQSSATLMPLDRWACIQYEIQQTSGMTGNIRVRVDGNLLSDLPQTATTTIAVNMSLGLDFYGNSSAIPVYDAWFDELIVDSQPTTCAQ